MGRYYKGKYYLVEKSELDFEKAKVFADQAVNIDESKNNTFNTYKYGFNQRWKNVCFGKLSEQAVALFLKEQFDYDFEINYDIYPGVFNVDEYDLTEKGFSFDIKSSFDTKAKDGDEMIRRYNFPVPKHNNYPKDITIGVMIEKEEKFYIVSWIDKDTYIANSTEGYWSNENTYWYKYPLYKGYCIKDLEFFFDKKNHFIDFIKNHK